MYILAPNTYPYSVAQLRRDNPGTSFPANPSDVLLAEWSVFPVTPVPQPEFDPLTQNCPERPPIEIDGVWTQQWEVVPASIEEIAERQQAIRARIEDGVQQRLDDFARTRGYDNIVSACSYATSQHPKYGPEGRYCVTVREDTWDTMFAIEAEVLAGTRPMPMSYEEIADELPVLVWPV